jgi:hypothetical protein|nr:MAG TPA: hypothetical protein [Caudoviricetes sp.]
MPTLKERIQSLTSSINEAKTSLRDALRNKGVDPGSQPSFEAIRLGVEQIPSGDKYKELIGKRFYLSVPSWILMKPLERWLWLQINPQSP